MQVRKVCRCSGFGVQGRRGGQTKKGSTRGRFQCENEKLTVFSTSREVYSSSTSG